MRAPRSILIAGTIAALLVGACGSGQSSSATVRGPSSTSSSTTTSPPDATITHVQLDLVDDSRPAVDPADERSAPTRALPTELYLPAGAGREPLIVFAHGYDGDPTKFTELFTAWAEAGFAVAAPRFPITATGASSAGLARSGDFAEQPADLSFVLDQLLDGEYSDRIDRGRIGAAGLSLGGVTTWGWIANSCCRDRRPRAAIIMDGNQFGFPDGEPVENTIPVLVYHADEDPALPFANAHSAYDAAVAPKYFVTIAGPYHAQPFEDSPAPSDDMVKRSSIDFWRAYLLDDGAARRAIVADATVPGVSNAESVAR